MPLHKKVLQVKGFKKNPLSFACTFKMSKVEIVRVDLYKVRMRKKQDRFEASFKILLYI